MELSQLEYFQLVSQCGKIKDAAEILHISPAGVSMAIARLEEELGVPLLERKGRMVTLTHEGQYFADSIAPAIAMLEKAAENVREVKENKPQVVAISFEAIDCVSILQFLFLRSQKRSVIFKNSLDTRVNLMSKLRGNMVDFCIMYEPMDSLEVASIKLIDEPIYVLLSAEDPLASRERLTPYELKEHPFLMPSAEYGGYKWLTKLCANAGFRPHERYIENDAVAGLHTVAEMRAAWIVGESFWKRYMNNASISFGEKICPIPLEGRFCRRQLFLAYQLNRVLSPGAADFLQFVKRCSALTLRNGSIPQLEELS